MSRDEELIAQLESPIRRERIEAAAELGHRRARQAVPRLIELLKDCKTVWGDAEYAARALGEIGDDRGVEPLLAALEEPFVGGAAIEALAKLHDERALKPLIRLFAKRPISSLATVLGRWGDTRAVGPLIAAMGDPDPHVRFYVARALGRLGDRRALPCLERARDTDTAPITDARSLRGKSVSRVASEAIDAISRHTESSRGRP